MTDFLGTEFVDKDGNKVGVEAVEGYKLIMVVYSASWWGGCTPFKSNLKNLYESWNADGAKNIQVVIVSGDRDENGFSNTTKDMPWVALPLGADKSGIEGKIPCTGYPTPGIVNAATGEVIDADAFGKVDQANYNDWISKCWDLKRTWETICK